MDTQINDYCESLKFGIDVPFEKTSALKGLIK